MAEGEQSNEDRTEAATARHLDQAREHGQAPISREVAAFAGLAAVLLVSTWQMPAMMRHLVPEMTVFLARASDMSLLRDTSLRAAMFGLAAMLLPVIGAASIAGGLVVLLQTQFLIHGGSLQPRMSRINPVANLKRLFGSQGLVEIVRSLVKLGLLAIALWLAIRDDWMGWIRLPWANPQQLPGMIARPIFHLMVAAVAAQGVVAGADLMWVRFRHARDLRMSKQDIRDELKDTEGNPHIKARIRRIQVMRARKRMMSKVPTATVVITNPTHYAIALAYDRANNPAPRVVAKGTDSLAARIRDVARANGVPVVANPPLARALYRLELETEIPAEYYKAVAEIIAYVWQLRQSKQAVT